MNHIVRQPAFTDLEIAAIQGVLHEFPLRDRLLLHVALLTGLRISSILRIRCRDVVTGGVVRTNFVVPRSAQKFGRGLWRERAESRIIPLAEPLRRLITELLFERFGGGPVALLEPLFRSREGNQLSRRQATQRLKDVMLRAGLHDRVGFGWHAARRWLARTAYYRTTNRDVISVAEMLGHKNLASCHRYIGVNQEVVAEGFAQVAALLPGKPASGGERAAIPSVEITAGAI